MQANRSPAMAKDLERWAAECKEAVPTEGINRHLVIGVVVVSAVLLGIVFRELQLSA